MDVVKNFLIIMIVILIFITSPIVYAKSEYHSFVDEIVDNPRVFDESLDDEFLAEKREINKLLLDQLIVKGKIQEFAEKSYAFRKKLFDLYGETYEDYDLAHATIKFIALYAEKSLTDDFPYKFLHYDKNKIKQALSDENNRKLFLEDIQKFLKGSLPLELIFHLDRQFVLVCTEILGESSPITLKDMKNLAQDYSLMGDSKTALEIEKNILPKILKTFGEKSIEAAEIFELMAIDYKILGNYAKSRENMLKAFDINKKIYGEESSPKLLSNIIELINLHRIVLRNDDLSPLYLALDKAAKNIPEDELYRRGYFRVKVLNSSKYDYEIDIHLNETRIKEIESFGNDPQQRDYYRNLFNRFFEMSDNDHKLGLYSAALSDDLLCIANCKIYLGNYHHETLRAICNLSKCYLAINQLDDALELSQDALRTSQKIYGDEHPCTVYAIHSVTNVYRAMKNYSNALTLDQQAYELCKKIFVTSLTEESREKLMALEDIAHDYEGLNDYSAAIKSFEEILSLYAVNNVNDFKSLSVRKNLAYLYNLCGNYEKTVALYDFLKESNELYSLDKLPADGIIAYQTATELGDALAVLGKNLAANRCYRTAVIGYESLRFLNLGLTNEEKQQWFKGLIPTYKKAAAFLVTQGNNKEAFRVSEYCRARGLSENYSDLLAIYKGGLSEEDIEALNIYQNNFFQYRDKFKRAFINGSNLLKLNLRLSQMKLNIEYNSFKRELHKKYPNYKEILNTGTIFHEDIFAPDQIKKVIMPNQCYITFSIINDKILVLIVYENGTINSCSISIDNNFFNECNLYHDLLAYNNINGMQNDGKYLWKLSDGTYKITNSRSETNATVIKENKEFIEIRQRLSAHIGDILLSPLSNYISSKTKWIISPDGELNNIPFETLQFNGKMAIESSDISYVPSFAVLKLMQEMGEKNSKLRDRKDIFAMGNAVYGNNDYAESRGLQIEFLEDIERSSDDYVDLTKLKWDNLPGTGEELKNVSALFSADKQEIITDIDASERNLKQRDKNGQLSQYKYLLFATHGLFLPTKPEYSSIVLSQGLNDENYDGYVTIGEWFGYNLNSDLVYLSACESGLGDYQAGEGIVGLPYALTVAGNKDTVMSLWKINDEAAAKFATVFFQKLKEGKTEVESLNETKREFLTDPNPKFNNPSTWAAFLLYGI